MCDVAWSEDEQLAQAICWQGSAVCKRGDEPFIAMPAQTAHTQHCRDQGRMANVC